MVWADRWRLEIRFFGKIGFLGRSQLDDDRVVNRLVANQILDGLDVIGGD
jgi:hypothetical protein